MTQLDPIVNQASLYINGLVVSNDPTTPNTVLNVAAGQCRDSNNIIDMLLGDYLAEGFGTPNSITILNAAVKGLNGLDTGSLAASTMYAVYMIGDSSNKNPTGVILSANMNTPVMPFGYDSYRKIAFWPTDGSSHFLKAYYSAGVNDIRIFLYDAPQATAVTAGTSTTYAAVNLTGLVPLVNNIPVILYTSYVPATAGNTLKLQPANATGDAFTITGQVATVAVTGEEIVLAQNLVISSVLSPAINYKVANGSDAAAVDVAGFIVNL